MLILSRAKNQRIVIDGQLGIWITVIEVAAGKVRLGFEGPKGVTIDREEVHRDKLKHGTRKRGT